MEKYGEIKAGLTPQLADTETKAAADCVKGGIVDNKEPKPHAVDDLDADFRKKAADIAAAKLNR